jgi:hypothetical protein
MLPYLLANSVTIYTHTLLLSPEHTMHQWYNTWLLAHTCKW